MFITCLAGIFFNLSMSLSTHCVEPSFGINPESVPVEVVKKQGLLRWYGPLLLTGYFFFPAVFASAYLGCNLYVPFLAAKLLGATHLQGLLFSAVGNVGFDKLYYLWKIRNMSPEQKKEFDGNYWSLSSYAAIPANFVAMSSYLLYAGVREVCDPNYQIGGK